MLSDIDTPTLPFGLSDVHRSGTDVNAAELALPQELNNQLRALARHFRVSLASLCHLAWAQVLSHTSGNEAVVFGTVLLGRLQSGEGNETAMGLLINTLPLRLDIDDTTVENAVRNAHSQLSSLLTHEYASLALAQRCSAVPVALPLFSALLNCRHETQEEHVTTELPTGVSVLNGDSKTNYPLSLSVDDDENSLNLSAQVILPVSATRICAYMQQALISLADAMTNTPQQSIRSLTVMPQEERKMLLHSWNQTKVNYPSVHYIHELFEAQVKNDGQAIAIECEGETINYSDLNAQANRLAHYLIAKGVMPDDRIALCVKRSTNLLVAILGILKSGGAYVPLDPAYSSQRLQNILEDAEPVCLLTDAPGQEALGDHQVPVVDLDQALPDGLSTANPDSKKTGISYGSSGLCNLHIRLDRNSESQDKWCLFHSYSFDFSVWEMWGALFNGSQLAIVPYNLSRSPLEFYEWTCSSGITVLNQTPSAFKTFMQMKSTSSLCDRLRYVVLGGEELDALTAKSWYEKCSKGQTTLVNMYGTTETTVHASYQRLESEKSVHSVGRPLADLCYYLLDAHSEPVPLGVEGELYIGGGGVARGYLNRPELTAERFLSDPFSDSPGARMYRTGDLARYLPDGNLVHLGRIDQQVKVRGFRVELGEIEARLIEHPQVSEAVVLLCKNNTDARLVAYVVVDPDESLAQNL
ncbi:uncharacterized protein LOC116351487, partial [Contarinia nasturtii]|uniref:uncharacterized protein LOC116351487 n=1 Tax=Contarinia nasturtii TaxID=265458 RepID=UPI0012D40B3F